MPKESKEGNNNIIQSVEMGHNQMQTRLPLTHAHTHAYIQQARPKVLVSTPANFTRTTDSEDLKYYQQRPLMLNAWTQTTSEDYEYLHETNNNAQTEQQAKTEKELLEKIRILEENLRAHSDILSQIHATSARQNALVQQLQQTQVQQTPQQQQSQPPQELRRPSPLHRNASPHNAQNLPPVVSAVPPPVQHNNPVPPQLPISTETVKYTIIAEGHGNVNGDPIEIELADDDGALNMNSSADSGRLEICLADENVDVKQELSPPKETQRTPEPFIKRRRLVTESEALPQNSNYYFNEHGMLTPMSGTATPPPVLNGVINKLPLSTPRLNININNNSLLKPALKHEVLSQSITHPTHLAMPTNTLSQKMIMDNVMVSIGPNNTRIAAKIYENISWASPSIATRKLLMAIFDRKTLATHSMTGKPSPAFKDHGKPLKEMLDPRIIQDIIFAVTRKCNVSDKEVRNSITTKCADENKMMKLQMNKNRTLRETNKENVA